jgi:hypothetical protein
MGNEENKQEYEYIGQCNGNNENGCLMDSSVYDCGCFSRILKEEPKKQKVIIVGNGVAKQVKDLAFYKANAEEDYLQVPISVIRYISQLEQELEKRYSEEQVKIILKKLFYTMANCDKNITHKESDFDEWFEQFKNK